MVSGFIGSDQIDSWYNSVRSVELQFGKIKIVFIRRIHPMK